MPESFQRACRCCEQILNAGYVLSPPAQRVIATIEAWPASSVDFDAVHASANVYAGADRIARLDVRRGEFVVHAPSDTLPALHRAFPSSQLRADGLVFDIDGRHDASAALAALRRRSNVQQLSWQFRQESP
jgi:hypothetical protein